MSAERLREILNNVADETRPVPLEAAAMAESRRMGVRRAVVGAAAMVVLLVAGVVGATNVWSDRGGQPVDPAVSDSPSPDVTTGNMQDTVLYYYDDTSLYALTDNNAYTTILTNEPLIGTTASVSPDGRYITWVNTDGELRLFDPADGTETVLTEDLADGSCQEAVWSVNSYELFVRREDGYGFYDVTTGVFTPLGFDFGGACHVQLDERPGSGDPAIEREFMYIDRDAKELVNVDDEGARVGAVSTLIGPSTQIISVQSRAGGGYHCFVTAAVDSSIGETIRFPTCQTLGEFNGETWDIVSPGANTPVALTVGDGGVLAREVDSGGTFHFTAYDEVGDQRLWSEPEAPEAREWNLLAWR